MLMADRRATAPHALPMVCFMNQTLGPDLVFPRLAPSFFLRISICENGYKKMMPTTGEGTHVNASSSSPTTSVNPHVLREKSKHKDTVSRGR